MYALVAAHLANVVFNWREMELPALRLLAFLVLAGVDTGVAVYYRCVRAVCAAKKKKNCRTLLRLLVLLNERRQVQCVPQKKNCCTFETATTE